MNHQVAIQFIIFHHISSNLRKCRKHFLNAMAAAMGYSYGLIYADIISDFGSRALKMIFPISQWLSPLRKKRSSNIKHHIYIYIPSGEFKVWKIDHLWMIYIYIIDKMVILQFAKRPVFLRQTVTTRLDSLEQSSQACHLPQGAPSF